MRQSQTPSHLSLSPSQPFDSNAFVRSLTASSTLAWFLIAGLPVLGIVAALLLQVPLFAALMGAGFLLATGCVAQRAVATFVGRVLRLLVAARLALVFTLGALLFCAGGGAWAALEGSVLLWLAADRLLGRRALHDLHRAVHGPR